MKPNAVSMTAAILLGGVMLLVGLANLINPHFGAEFLRTMGSLDPGFHLTGTVRGVFLGTVYGVVEGAIAGYLFGAIYGAMTRHQHPAMTQGMNRVA